MTSEPNSLQRYLGERLIGPAAQHVLRHPGVFALADAEGLPANQGLLLAGAVAYYALLSIVPLLILTVIALSQRDRPARAARRPSAATSNGWCPGQSRGDRRASSPTSSTTASGVGWLLLGDDDLLQLARLHGARERDVGDLPAPRRRPEAPLHLLGADPVLYILSLGVGLLLVTLVAGGLQAVGKESVELFGRRVVAERPVGRAALPARAAPARSSC